ncbi:MAG: S8 family serine peptidase [Candidatus Zixiibacteriota bacterium]|nr:MAG: S8 family serine peptidase [candidate division Zixibacteria bacterium]
MNRVGLILAMVFLAMLVIVSKAFALSERSKIHFEEGVNYVPDAVVVAFSSDILPLNIHTGHKVIITGRAGIDNLNSRFEVSEFRRIFPGAENKGEIELAGYYSITFDSGNEMISVLEAYDALIEVEHVEPIAIHPIDYDPNDPQIGQQWAINKIEARGAWDISQGDSNIVVGIADTGVDWDHPDLADDIWVNEAEVNGISGFDDDGNNYIDDYRGWDWVHGVNGAPGEDDMNPDNDPMDFNGHGTHCSGVSAAVTDNGIGIAGVGFNCRVMPLRVGWQDPTGQGYIRMDFAAQAFYYATDNGARSINCSWSSSNSGGLGAATTYATNNGVIVVSSAGNSNNQNPSYLGSRPDVVTVASTDQNDFKSSFSNYGAWVDISAPGTGIYSTYFNDSYFILDGTSMAAPHVVGLAALIWASEPDLTDMEVISRILSTADNIDSLNPSYSGLLGAGRINAYAALASIHYPNIIQRSQTVNITAGDGDGILNPGETFELVVTLENIWADAQNVDVTLSGNDDFIMIDSTASYGNIPGGQTNNNSSDPFVITVNSLSIPGTKILNMNIAADGYDVDRELSIFVSLYQANFPLDIPDNIESSPVIVDFDGDGQNEIVFGASDNNVYAIEQDGRNSPGWPQPVTGDVVGAVAVGDIDINNHLNVVAVTKDGRFYAWNADGSLLPNFPVDKGGIFYSGVMLADIDGDYNLEIIAGSFSNNNIYVLSHDGTDYPGWPFTGSGRWYGSPAAGDIDEDGLTEIVYAGFDSCLHVFNADLSYFYGFPVQLDNVVWGSVAIGDVTPSPNMEIAAATSSGNLYLINYDGSVAPGFPVLLNGVVKSAPSLADIDGDGLLEILIGSNNGSFYVFDRDGTALPGFPVSLGGSITAQAIIGDINGDSSADIIAVTGGGDIHCFDGFGNFLPNFPISPGVTGPITATPALGKLDSDPDMEIVVGMKTNSQNLIVIDYKSSATMAGIQWPNFGRDIWRSNGFANVVTSVSENPNIPNEFELLQNYPNPFNARTVIAFNLPAGSRVRLDVYDILGRQIETLVDKDLPAGYNSVSWNAENKSSGIYFYRIMADDRTSTRRMLLVK